MAPTSPLKPRKRPASHTVGAIGTLADPRHPECRLNRGQVRPAGQRLWLEGPLQPLLLKGLVIALGTAIGQKSTEIKRPTETKRARNDRFVSAERGSSVKTSSPQMRPF